MIKRLVVPLDGSPLAEQALPYAIEIARRATAELILVTAVVPLASWDAAAGAIKWDREYELARDYVEGVRARLAADGTPVSAFVTWGEAAESIELAAADNSADLIIMTSHGRSGLARAAMGSVASEVLHESATPVVIVKATDTAAPPAPRLDRILFPMDGSDLSLAALPFVRDFAQTLGASVVVYHTVTLPSLLYPGAEAWSGYDRMAAELETAARDLVERGAAELRSGGLEVETDISIGAPADEIVAAASRNNAALIAMSTHGRSGLGRWLLGSVADAVVRRSDVPCLLVRPAEVTRREPGRSAAATPADS